MKNGTYNIKHKMLNSDHVLVCYNGIMKIDNKRTINLTTLNEHYTIIKEVKAIKSLYNINWIINGRVREVISMNAPFAVCKWKIESIKNIYKPGILIPVKII